jgi:hypothetical protein
MPTQRADARNGHSEARMPDYLASIEPEDPIEIPGTGGRQVVFRSGASYGDDLAIDIAANHAVAVPPGVPTSPEQDQERHVAYVLARTVRMIVSWGLEDAEGQPLPITAESLKRLTPAVGGWLNTEAYRRFQGRSEEAERPFERPSLVPSEAAAP